jgi:hypothetical protein
MRTSPTVRSSDRYLITMIDGNSTTQFRWTRTRSSWYFTFIPNRVYKCGIMEKRVKLGAVVVVQNCACEDESEGVEFYGGKLGSLL